MDLETRKKEIEEEFSRLATMKQQVDTRLFQLQGKWEAINEILLQLETEKKEKLE